MKNYIWVVTEHRTINGGATVSTSHYYRAESEDKAKAKYEALCDKYEGRINVACTYDDNFSSIEEIDGEELRSSFRDYEHTGKAKGRTHYEVEIGPEIIK